MKESPPPNTSRFNLPEPKKEDESILTTVRKEAKQLQLEHDKADLARLDKEIKVFETQYNMSSEIFLQKYQTGKLTKSVDFFEWKVLCKMRLQVKQRLNS